MRLKSVRVTNFRSVKDSTKFSVEPDVTCLVGKNESGKTALLQAMALLNPLDVGSVRKLSDLDYPRHEKRRLQKQTESGRPVEAVETIWILETSDKDALRGLVGPVADDVSEISGTLKYDEQHYYSPLGIDVALVIKHLLESHDLPTEERDGLADSGSIAVLTQRLSALEDPSQRQKNLLSFVQENFGDKTVEAAARNLLHRRRPKLAYFGDYSRMPGRLSLTDYKQRMAQKTLRDGDQIFEALLAMTGQSAEDLESIDQFEELRAELEAISNDITGQIFEYWHQNRHLSVDFDCRQGMPNDEAPFNTGVVLHTRIKNTRHGVTTSFDDRSAGFVWFFSFLVWFGQVKERHGDNVILLLDEPGLSLHAKAQYDLLRYFDEKLAPHHQVIYSTHSPFMIDAAKLMRARTVEDVFVDGGETDPHARGQDLGTKVGSDVLSTDRDTVFPLQACLGYEITQSLFVGKHCLLVEGPSDVLFLQWFSEQLRSQGRPHLDPRWTITPCGGLDKVSAFMSLFGGNGLDIAVLTDFKRGDKRKVEKLRDDKLLAGGRVITAERYVDQEEADTEDIIGTKLYADLINAMYGLKGKSAFSPDAGERVVKLAEEFCRMLPPEAADFSHYAPAEYLMRNGLPEGASDFKAAMDRFERLFAEVNSLLDGGEFVEVPQAEADAPVVEVKASSTASKRKAPAKG
jgi:predicted ATPase